MNYTTNHYYKKKFKDSYLITTPHGDFITLDEKQLRQLEIKIEDKTLFDSLKEKCIILTEDNLKTAIDKTKKKFHHVFNGTSLHIIVPTVRCNYRCVYCHSKVKPLEEEKSDMDIGTAEKTVDFILQSPAKSISIEFQGGEPLLRFDIIKHIVEYTEKTNTDKEIFWSLVSNLSLIDTEKLRFIKEHKISLCTSLDGPENVHNLNRLSCAGLGTHSKLIKDISLVREHDVNIEALMVTTRHSLGYEEEIIDEYIKNGFKKIQIKFLNKLGFAPTSWDKISYSAEEYLDFWKKSLDYIVKKNKQGVALKEMMTFYILNNILKPESANFVDLQNPCGAAIGQLAYNYNGDIYTCDEGRQFDIFKLGNVHSSNYNDVLTSDSCCNIIASSINETQLCDACAFKPYCGLCPVCNYAEHNNLIVPCSASFRCKVLKGMFGFIFEKYLFDAEYKHIFEIWLK